VKWHQISRGTPHTAAAAAAAAAAVCEAFVDAADGCFTHTATTAATTATTGAIAATTGAITAACFAGASVNANVANTGCNAARAGRVVADGCGVGVVITARSLFFEDTQHG
jgi:hypothetical protein